MYMHTVDSNNNNKKYRNQSFYMDLIYAIMVVLMTTDDLKPPL